MAKVNEIYRVSIIPFYLGNRINKLFPTKKRGGQKRQTKLSELKTAGFNLVDENYVVANKLNILKYAHLLEVENDIFHYDATGIEFNLYITKSGFGIIQYEERQEFEGDFLNLEATANLVERRREFHRSICATNSKHEIIATAKQFTKILAAGKHPKLANYVFSYFAFSLNEELPKIDVTWLKNQPSKDFQKYVWALLHPSRFSGNTKEMIENFQLTDDDFMQLEKGDIDPKINVLGLASWSSLLIFAPRESEGATNFRDILALYESMEVRTQLAWSIAHMIEKDCQEELNLDRETGVLDSHRKSLSLLTNFSEIPNADVSGRDRKIWDGLRETSSLELQINSAKEVYELLDDREKGKAGKNAERNQFWFAATAAVFTLVSVFYGLPLVHGLSQWWLFLLLPFILLLPIISKRSRRLFQRIEKWLYRKENR